MGDRRSNEEKNKLPPKLGEGDPNALAEHWVDHAAASGSESVQGVGPMEYPADIGRANQAREMRTHRDKKHKRSGWSFMAMLRRKAAEVDKGSQSGEKKG